MKPDPDHKVAMVTGGSCGIGKAVVRALAAAGYSVHCCSTTSARIEAAVEEMQADGLEVSGSVVDVADRKAVVDFIREVVLNNGSGTFSEFS